MRVLVVEDEQDVGDVFLDYLVELGHDPLLVRTAEDALGEFQIERPDAIILDIHLPGMSGLDFLQLPPIRESGVPVVAVSGVATENQARECLRLGAVDFVGKPLPFERLQEVLNDLDSQTGERTLRMAPGARLDRRDEPRASLTIPIRVHDENGTVWEATSVDMSPGGIRVSARAPSQVGSLVQLSFTPPDGGTSMTATAVVTRVDLGGYAFAFINLPAAARQRLRQLITRLS